MVFGYINSRALASALAIKKSEGCIWGNKRNNEFTKRKPPF